MNFAPFDVFKCYLLPTVNTLKYNWDLQHVEEMLRYIVDIQRETDTDTQQNKVLHMSSS